MQFLVINPKIKKVLIYTGIGVLLLMYAAVNLTVYRYSQGGAGKKLFSAFFDRFRNKKTTPIAVPTPTPTPTPYPIAQGKQEYIVNARTNDGPKLLKAIINPLDPKIGDAQSVSVTIKSTTPVGRVMVALRTDNDIFTNHQLVLDTGTNKDGSCTGSWKTENKHDYLYQITLTATNDKESSSATITVR